MSLQKYVFWCLDYTIVENVWIVESTWGASLDIE
jgi:hypothetical protein